MKSARNRMTGNQNIGLQTPVKLDFSARVWHLQDHKVAFVFEDPTLGEKVNPDRTRRRTPQETQAATTLELARENVRLVAEKAVLARKNEQQSDKIGQLLDT